jgi:hypothetical protein
VRETSPPSLPPSLNALDVVRERAHRQSTTVASRKARPEEVVASLGAVQAQDYRGALWGIGLRTTGATEREVEAAIAARAIVRTWPMRGTLHFVAASDVRWMLRLLTPRIVTRCRTRNRALGLDDATLTKSRAQLAKALTRTKGGSLTRPEAYAVLERAGIATGDGRGLQVLLMLGMEGTLCFGARRGRQPTFVLLDEWIPKSRVLTRDEALTALAERYFTSHGPAKLADFAWWTGLTLADARRGVEAAGKALVMRATSGGEQWTGRDSRAPAPKNAAPSVQLLPPYDELTVAYQDRSAFLDPAHAERTRNGIFSAVVLVGGRIAGVWRRTEKPGQPARVHVDVELLGAQPAAVRKELEREATRYGVFLEREASLALRALP